MGQTIKDVPITKNSNPTKAAPPGGTLQDITSLGTKKETVSSENLTKAADTSTRPANSSTPSGGTDMGYQYRNGDMVQIDRAGSPSIAPTEGKPSLFNPYAIFTHPNCNDTNDFYDVQGKNGPYPKNTTKAGSNGRGGRSLNIEGILSDFDPKTSPTEPYYASDFLFSRYYKRIPFNRLITLRRFPFPTYDNLLFDEKVPQTIRPIAQAVTYFGDPTGNALKDLTKISGKINWKDLTANVHDVEGQGTEQDFDSTPFINKTGKLKNGLRVLGSLGAPGKQDITGHRAEEIEAAKKYNNFEYTNKVLGPVNVVNMTKVRDRGLGASRQFDIVFEYEMRSYNKINPRVAMLDLICNMLALTFNNAKFWGGANRYFPNSPQFAFLGDQKSFYDGRYGDYIHSVVKTLGDGLGKGLDILGNLISGILSGNFNSLMNVAKGGATAVFDMQSRKNRPQILGFHALLTGLPVGEWHLTIGNPYRPTMRIGNLICNGFEFFLDGHMSVDDFPSMLNFKIKLEDGRPRDKGDIESLLNQGQGRMYYPPLGLIDITNSSSATGTQISSEKDKRKSATKHVTPAGDATSHYVGNDVTNRAGVDGAFMRKLIGTAF